METRLHQRKQITGISFLVLGADVLPDGCFSECHALSVFGTFGTK